MYGPVESGKGNGHGVLSNRKKAKRMIKNSEAMVERWKGEYYKIMQ